MVLRFIPTMTITQTWKEKINLMNLLNPNDTREDVWMSSYLSFLFFSCFWRIIAILENVPFHSSLWVTGNYSRRWNGMKSFLQSSLISFQRHTRPNIFIPHYFCLTLILQNAKVSFVSNIASSRFLNSAPLGHFTFRQMTWNDWSHLKRYFLVLGVKV